MSGTATTSATTGALTIGAFFDAVLAGRLVVQRCTACETLAVPPKAVCPSCEAMSWGRTSLAGAGEVASYTVIRVAPGHLAAEAPYTIVVVRMAEGVSLLGRMVGTPIDAVRVGLPVRFAGAADPTAQPPVLTFRPR